MFLADDGRGGEISIPAVLISLSDGEKLIEYYSSHLHDKSHRIRLEIHFLLEKTDNTVKFDIWFTPDQEKVYKFLKDFERYQNLLDTTAILDVHYITYPFFSYNPNNNQPIEDCLGCGLYCVRPGKTMTDGALIALESIKQKCIYKYSYDINKNSKSRQLFWNYMIRFYDNCINGQNNYNKICSDNIIKSIGINKDEIDQCVYNSFIGTSFEKHRVDYHKMLKNKILDEEYEIRKTHFITRVPSLTINGKFYDGSWKAEYVFDALCASLNKKPSICFIEGTQTEVQGFSAPAVFVIILVVLAINVTLFIICKNFIKNRIIERIKSTDIESRIDQTVNQYLSLSNQPLL